MRSAALQSLTWLVQYNKESSVRAAPGTLAYMAPEQATGQADKLTARIDVFRRGHKTWGTSSQYS